MKTLSIAHPLYHFIPKTWQKNHPPTPLYQQCRKYDSAEKNLKGGWIVLDEIYISTLYENDEDTGETGEFVAPISCE